MSRVNYNSSNLKRNGKIFLMEKIFSTVHKILCHNQLIIYKNRCICKFHQSSIKENNLFIVVNSYQNSILAPTDMVRLKLYATPELAYLVSDEVACSGSTYFECLRRGER